MVDLHFVARSFDADFTSLLPPVVSSSLESVFSRGNIGWMPNRDREEMQSKRSVSLLEGYSELWMYLRGHGLVVPRLGTCTEAEESSQESEESLRCCGGVLPLLAFGQSCGVGRGSWVLFVGRVIRTVRCTTSYTSVGSYLQLILLSRKLLAS